MNELIEAYKSGDASAYNKIFVEYNQMIYKNAYLITRSAEAAFDITQETFIILFTKLESWNGKGSAQSWLYRIAVNCSLTYLRKEKARKINVTDCIEVHSTRIDLTEKEVLNNEEKEILRIAIDRLPNKVSVVLVLRYYNDFSQDEIARILKIPLGTVKSRINRGLKKLRSYLREEYNNNSKYEMKGGQYNDQY